MTAVPNRVLLTGAGGFLGIHVIDHILATTDWHVVALDSFRHKGITDRLRYSEHVRAHPERVTVLQHDLNAPISAVLAHDIGAVDAIINAASESHVDRSLDDPVRFVQNNVNVALHMLEFARAAQPRVFVQVSTDEVYGPAHGNELHKEWAPILPSNPYSGSKACQEALCIGWWRSFGVPVVICNAMNLIGEYQDPEKFVPKAVRSILAGEPVDIHMTNNVVGSRCWLHARNYADAVCWIIRALEPVKFGSLVSRPDRFNIVGERHTNEEMAVMLANACGRLPSLNYVDYHIRRTGHDLHYGLDGTKLAALGWRAPLTLADSLARTVAWYRANPQWLAL